MSTSNRNSSERTWDVIVVGAGPAGSTCAQLLAERGHSVLLLERELQPGACANCTGIIGDEAFRVFNLPRGLVVNSFSDVRFIGPYGREVGFSAGKTLAHVVRRHAFDAALAERAIEAGAELRVGVRVTGGSRDENGLEVHGFEGCGADAAAAMGRNENEARDRERAVTFRARALVLAVGYHLALLETFSLNGHREFVQGAQLLCRNRGVEQVEVYVGKRFAPGSFGWAVPLQPGWVKVGLTTVKQARSYLDALTETDHLRDRIDMSDSRIRLSPIPIGSMERCHSDRILVVGEAAGQVKTTSNGGIYYSMLGARAAAETLDDCLARDQLDAAGLQTYETAWRQVLEAELVIGRGLRTAIESMSDAKLAGLMWLASVDGVMDMIRDGADFDWHRPLIDELARHRLVGPFFGRLLDRNRAPAG